MSKEIGILEPIFSNVDSSSVPQTVVEGAEKIADELADKNSENHQNIVNQLIGSYIAAGDKDIVIFFNSGGMGWNAVSNTPGWESILNGITSELTALGYKPLVLNYCRTGRDFWGNIKEVIEAATRYPKKVVGMEKYVEFLVDHLPDVKFIIAAESTGSVIAEQAMGNFRNNPNVYSIQTGCPFWYKTAEQARTVRVNSNGFGNDAFSHGNVPSMVWSTFKSWFGLSSPEENAGNILKSLRAPGHDYSWKYDSISSSISEFLVDNFSKEN